MTLTRSVACSALWLSLATVSCGGGSPPPQDPASAAAAAPTTAPPPASADPASSAAPASDVTSATHAAGIYLAAHLHFFKHFSVQWGIGAAVVIGALEGAVMMPTAAKAADAADKDLAAGSETWGADYLKLRQRLMIFGGFLSALVLVTVYIMTVSSI